MRRVPRNYPTTPLLHFGNASLGQNCTIEAGVVSPECSADMECDTFLVHTMDSQEELEDPRRARWRIRSASRILTFTLIKVALWESNASNVVDGLRTLPA